jgi:ABC-type uncharacterized transport system substrate-binding protein
MYFEVGSNIQAISIVCKESETYVKSTLHEIWKRAMKFKICIVETRENSGPSIVKK